MTGPGVSTVTPVQGALGTSEGALTQVLSTNLPAASTVPYGSFALTADLGPAFSNGNAWQYAAPVAISVISASGDATGAKDVTNLQTALTAARVAGGGYVRGVAGSTYYINAPLIIGSMTTLDMTGCTIILVAGTNLSMLMNYAMTAPVATGNVTTVGGNKTIFAQAGNNALYQYVVANTISTLTWPNVPGLTMTVPMNFGSVASQFVGTVAPFPGSNQFTVDVAPPSTLSSQTLASLWLRDVGIRVVGGIWNRGTNVTTHSPDADHNIRIRFADWVWLDDITQVCGNLGSATVYGFMLQAVSHVKVRRAGFGANPGASLWGNGNSGYFRDGVHIEGPAQHIHVSDTYGLLGDDANVVLTGTATLNITGDYTGSVSDVTFEDIRAPVTTALAKLIAGPSTTISRVHIKGLYGSNTNPVNNGILRPVWIGDDNRFSCLIGGTIDDVIIEDVFANPIPANPTIWLGGAGLGRIKIKKVFYDNSSGTNNGIIEIGTANATGTAQATTIAELTVDDLIIKGIGGSTNVLYDAGHATVTALKTSGWSAPLTNFPLVAITGAVTNWDMKDKMPISLSSQAASIGATNILVVPSGGAGVYRVAVDLRVVTGGTSGTLLASVISNNGTSSLTQSTSTINLASAGAEISATFTGYCAAGTNLQYSTTLSGTAGALQYSLSVRTEFIG